MSYLNRPEGEMYMMIGFFLMNGFCVVFFLLFGLCVIFSCLRQRPKFFRGRQSTDRLQTTSTIPTSKFRTHVSRAIRSGALKSMKKASEGIDCIVEEKQLDDETSQQCVVEKRNSDEVENQVHLPKLSLQSDENFRVLRSVQIEETHANTSSIVRQNLLGPLSFDDLHYT